MKKIKQFAGVLAAALLLCLLTGEVVQASQATSYTYTVDEDYYYTRTQDAYLPDKTITDLGLSAPEDIFIDENNMLYLADSGNRRILIYDIEAAVVAGELKWEEFAQPKGVFVTDEGEIYVADSKAKAVFVFDRNLEHKKTYYKPDTPAFADTAFEPLKVAVDNRRNIYIIGEGVSNGVIQLADNGDFLGYFAVNKTKLSWFQMMQSIFFTREQLDSLLDRNPPTFSNLTIDDRGIVYTTTMGNYRDGVKKHRTNGGNIFANQTVFGEDNFTDICVNDQGVIFACSKDGYITVYTASGEYVFVFGATYFGKDVSGLYTTLSTLAVDQNGNIWTADSYKGYLQSFRPTDYTNTVYAALDLFDQGRYDDALEAWTEVLRLNQMSILAHDGIGKAYLYNRDYESAMEHFRVSGNRISYSDAFWEVRNLWLQSYLQYVVVIAVVLFVGNKIIQKLDKGNRRKQWKQNMTDRMKRVPVLGELMYACRIPFHPIDRYYDIRVHKAGSTAAATVLYLLFFMVYMLYTTGKGYIYQYEKVENMDINAIVMGFFVLAGLFVFCNWLVSSINDGEGSLKQIYITVAYGSVPCLLSLLAVTGLSYVLTYNETFLLTFLLLIGTVWSLIAIFIGLQTIHDYSGKETVKSILITLLFMIIIAVVLLVIIIMWDQVWKFLSAIRKELVRNVLR